LKYSQKRKAFGRNFKHQAIAFKCWYGDANHG
jgi:hypothetical protein